MTDERQTVKGRSGQMKIKKVTCEQFAGAQDREIAFEDGLNIIVGENESGKSTIVDLIYHLLFKSVKLDGRSDAEFMDRYFPKKISGHQGDVVDGVLRFETSNGSYKISKEWGKGQGSCKLTIPDGTIIRSTDEINKILRDELGYGEGVWGEVVFASQKRRQNMVECILQDLDAKKKTADSGTIRKDLTATVTQAVMETGGVSLDRLETQLKEIISGYQSHWDFSADLPEGGVKRGIHNEWKREAGLILQAYYTKERLAEAQADAEAAEKNVESRKAEIREISAEKKEVEAKRESFRKYKSALEQRLLLQRQIATQKAALSERENALKKWPGLEAVINEASELQIKQSLAKIHDLFLEIEKLQSDYEAKVSKLQTLIPADPEDVKSVQKLQKRQTKLEGQITGLNLVAKIKQLGDTPIEVCSAASGLPVPATEGELAITEAVEIKIAGVMEMQLMPQGIDLDGVKGELQEISTQISRIYKKYGVESLEELQDKAGEYDRLGLEVTNSKNGLALKLGAFTWEELQKQNAQVPADIPTEAEVKRQIGQLCGNTPVDRFIGGLESTRNQYAEKYVSMDKLKEDIEEQKKQILENENRLDVVKEIPEEYREIQNPDQYEADLRAEIEDIEKELEVLRDDLSEAERKLGDRTAEEYSEELAKAEDDFKEKKAVCARWKHIYEVFLRLKEEAKGNPMQDIEEKFREYLSEISDGGVSLASPIDDRMTVKLASGNHALTYETLSNGTEETISLAFRLAMLEHLFPNGGGLAVFDDPFTDMDPKRVEQSCRLIQKYAENNQVIFITCDSKYRQMMSGNVISVSRQSW